MDGSFFFLYIFNLYIILFKRVASLAQLVEQLTLNQWVTGSIPARGTIQQINTW